MKPKALMLSAAVLLASAGLAFAQTYSQPPQTPAGPTSPQPGASGTKQAQSQTPRTSKHRVMASRRYQERATERDPATTALNLLEEKGYRDFSSFHRSGRDYEITANRNGKSVNVMVNPETRTVRTQG